MGVGAGPHRGRDRHDASRRTPAMNTVFIALNGLRLTFRHREATFWILIGPLIFTTFFGILFKAHPPRPTSLEIVNEDRTDLVANELATRLQRDAIVVIRAQALTASRPALVVPPGADEAWSADTAPGLTL